MIKRINELDLMVIDNKIYAEMARKYMLKKNVYRYNSKKLSDMDDDEIIQKCHCWYEENDLVDDYREFERQYMILLKNQENIVGTIDDIYGEIELNFQFFYNQLKNGMNVNEICFEFKDDVEDKEYYLGYFSNHEKPYWVGQCDIKDGCGFYIVEDLINAKIYNGKSLLECWDNISLLTIEGVPIDEWLEYFEHC